MDDSRPDSKFANFTKFVRIATNVSLLLASGPALRTIVGMVARAKKHMSNGLGGGDDAVSALHFRKVTDETWQDFEKLFESRGSPKNCWCMVWRGTGVEAAHTDGASRKAAMKKRVHTGVPIGILGYIGEMPVAWCSIAPRETYRASMAEAQNGDADEIVWSIVCFFVSRSARGQGTYYRLLQAAESHAKACGATVLEGYPVDEDSPSYRFGGFLPSFDKAGFTPVGRAGTRRHIVRKGLS